MQWAQKQGFTIVELLIVIVVIAILAAITIVAYTGIQERAKASAMQSAASQEAKKAPLYAVDNADLFPADEATFFAFANLADTSDTDYVYLVSPDRTHYCVSATNIQNTAISYAVSDTSGGTVEGKCVRNMASNPSFELYGVSGGYAVSQGRQTSGGYVGTGFMRATRNGTTGVWGPWWDAAANIIPGNTYSFSFYTRQTVNTAREFRLEWLNAAKDGYTGNSNSATVAYGNTWTAVTETRVAPASTAHIRIAYYKNNTGTTSDYVDVDAVMVVQESVPYDFADGSSSGWSWDGAEHASTSFGPAKQL